MTEGQSASETMKAGNAVEPVEKGPPNIECIGVGHTHRRCRPYRAVARRIRREAANVKDAAIRSQLLEIATTYEKLAESIEKQR